MTAIDNDTVKIIQGIVCKQLRTDPNAIWAKTRKRDLVEARYFIMYYLRKYTARPWVDIGGVFLNDHATAMHAFRTVDGLIRFNGYRKQDALMRSMIEAELNCVDLEYYNSVGQL